MKRMKVAAMQDFGLIITSRLLIWVKEEGKSSLTSWLLVVLPFLKQQYLMSLLYVCYEFTDFCNDFKAALKFFTLKIGVFQTENFLIVRFIDIFGFTCSFNFVSTTDENKKDGATWNGVIRDHIDNEKLNSEIVCNEIVKSFNGFRVTSNNNSGNGSGVDIHSDSGNYDLSDEEWLQKQYKQ